MYINVGSKPRSATRTIVNDLLWPIVFFITTIAFTIPFFLQKTAGVSTTDNPMCLASGEPWFPRNGTINQYWDVSTALFITLGNGSYTYPEAKAIDVTWDLLVGRGGQVLATVMGYSVIRRSLLYAMEQAAVSIPLVHSIYVDKLGSGFLGTSLRHFGHSNHPGQTPDTKRVPVLRLLSWAYICIYVVILPTIMSAMTGYQTNSDIFFHPRLLSDDLLASATALKPNPPLVIRDGHRIGMADNVPITLPDPSGIDFNATYNTMLGYYFVIKYVLGDFTTKPDWSSGWSDFSDTLGPPSIDPSKPVWGICTLTRERNGCNATQLVGNATIAPDPYLPVRPVPSLIWTNITLENHTYTLQSPPLDIEVTGPPSSWSLFLGSNDALIGYFSNATVADGAVCQPTAQYIWGFSAMLLLLLSVLTILFATTLLALQTEVYLCSQANRSQVVENGYKDAVYVVQALKEAHDVKEEDELLKEMDGRGYRPKKGGLAVQTESLPRARMRRRGFVGRFGGNAPADIPLLEREQSLMTTSTITTSFAKLKKDRPAY
ncbi:hypothetical protein LTR78_006804 [Recurvomyces mirabilis]|uniref:Uncharacterized protein n=1 Tax=Recurvomyces mirabilis TaxID=574656 RepID=A0AAE0WK88_9PEZI|nr:hypothetical protein LTR78_006804 [Recurvomyces mirabilis]KAK5153206.1 hypothetical protein LTS14_007851 [Recurvomyces mirabilis]